MDKATLLEAARICEGLIESPISEPFMQHCADVLREKAAQQPDTVCVRDLLLWNDTRLRQMSNGLPVRDLAELLAKNSAYFATGNPLAAAPKDAQT